MSETVQVTESENDVEVKEEAAADESTSTPTSNSRNITVIKVKPADASSKAEDTRLICLVPVSDSKSSGEDVEVGEPSQIHKNLTEIQEAQADVKRLDILVCGKCHAVFHFMEEFSEHKSDPTCLKPAYRTNISESKPQVWAFLLWKANVGRKLQEDDSDSSEQDRSSWGLYKRWCRLPTEARDAWIAAGRAIQVTSALGAATVKQIHHPVRASLPEQLKVKVTEETSPSTDSVKKVGRPMTMATRAVRVPIKRSLVPDPSTMEPLVKITRITTEPEKPKAITSVATQGKRPKGVKDNDNESYVVEKVLAKRYNQRTKEFEFLVKWEGYPQDQNTWEPRSNMEDCGALVQAFETNLARQKARQAEAAGHKVVTKTVKLPQPPPASTAAAVVKKKNPVVMSPTRPVRSSKTKAMENVKSWCGSIGSKHQGSTGSDSDEDVPTTSQAATEATPGGLLKSLSLVKSPGRPPKVPRPVNGEQKPLLPKPPATPPVLVANSKGVIKVDPRQVSTLSSGVYIVSNQSGVVKLSGQEKTAGRPRLLPKGTPIPSTGIVRIQSKTPPAPAPTRNPRPRLLTPRVLGPRTPSPRFVPRPPALLRPPAPRGSPRPPLRPVSTGVRAKQPETKPAASKLSQLLSMPKTMKATQSPLAKRSVTSTVAKKPPVKSRPVDPMEMDFDEPATESDEEDDTATPAFSAADKTPSPLGSPAPLTLCPETGKILGRAEGEATPSPEPEPQSESMLAEDDPGEPVTASTGHEYAAQRPSLDMPSLEVPQEEPEYVTITGDDGVVYQIATNGSSLVEGETMLLTEDGQQCMYVSSQSDSLSLDSAVAEAVAQLGDSIGANSHIVMAGSPVLMTVGEEGGEERAAQVVAHIVDEGDTGGMKKVILLLPDGQFMMTEVDEQQYEALNIEK